MCAPSIRPSRVSVVAPVEPDFLSTVHGVSYVCTNKAYALLSVHRAIRLLQLKTPNAWLRQLAATRAKVLPTPLWWLCTTSCPSPSRRPETASSTSRIHVHHCYEFLLCNCESTLFFVNRNGRRVNFIPDDATGLISRIDLLPSL